MGTEHREAIDTAGQKKQKQKQTNKNQKTEEKTKTKLSHLRGVPRTQEGGVLRSHSLGDMTALAPCAPNGTCGFGDPVWRAWVRAQAPGLVLAALTWVQGAREAHALQVVVATLFVFL